MRTGAESGIPAVLAFWHVAAQDADRPPDSSAAQQRLLDRDPESLILAEEDGRLATCNPDDYAGGRAA